MGMRDKNMLDAADVPRRQSCNISQVEQDRSPFELRAYEKRGISEPTIDQAGDLD